MARHGRGWSKSTIASAKFFLVVNFFVITVFSRNTKFGQIWGQNWYLEFCWKCAELSVVNVLYPVAPNFVTVTTNAIDMNLGANPFSGIFRPEFFSAIRRKELVEFKILLTCTKLVKTVDMNSSFQTRS